jgi:hypothetical protein
MSVVVGSPFGSPFSSRDRPRDSNSTTNACDMSVSHRPLTIRWFGVLIQAMPCAPKRQTAASQASKAAISQILCVASGEIEDLLARTDHPVMDLLDRVPLVAVKRGHALCAPSARDRARALSVMTEGIMYEATRRQPLCMRAEEWLSETLATILHRAIYEASWRRSKVLSLVSLTAAGA